MSIIQLYIDANLSFFCTLTYILIYAIYFCNQNDAIKSAYPVVQYMLTFHFNWFQNFNPNDKSFKFLTALLYSMSLSYIHRITWIT